jgi:hypothetical protein
MKPTIYEPTPAPDGLLGEGLWLGVSELRYHADPCVEPSLSSSVLRTVLGQSVGHAKRQHPRLSSRPPQESTPAMVVGSVLHALLSGDATGLALDGDWNDYRSKPAREWRDAALAAGRTPVLPEQFQRAERLAAAVKAEAGKGLTIDPTASGWAEVTAIWREWPWGKDGPVQWCRARYDRLILDTYADLWDWKTTSCELTADRLSRHMADFGYAVQAAMYLRGLEALRPDYVGRCTWAFVFIESAEPHAVQRVAMDEAWLAAGAAAFRRGRDLWAAAYRADDWPLVPMPGGTLTVEAPGWHLEQLDGNRGEIDVAA